MQVKWLVIGQGNSISTLGADLGSLCKLTCCVSREERMSVIHCVITFLCFKLPLGFLGCKINGQPCELTPHPLTSTKKNYLGISNALFFPSTYFFWLLGTLKLNITTVKIRMSHKFHNIKICNLQCNWMERYGSQNMTQAHITKLCFHRSGSQKLQLF